MSTSNKPSLCLSPLTNRVYIARESRKQSGVIVGEKTDVTGLFIGIMLAKFGPVDPETKASTDLISPDPTAPKYKVTIERIES